MSHLMYDFTFAKDPDHSKDNCGSGIRHSVLVPYVVWCVPISASCNATLLERPNNEQ